MKPVATQDVLFVIYSLDQNERMSRFIDMVYSENGIFDFHDKIKDESLLNSFKASGRVGPFETEDELVQFSYDICEKANMESVCLCNVESVNKSLKEAGNVNKMNEHLIENGEILTNPDAKKGFLSRIIS